MTLSDFYAALDAMPLLPQKIAEGFRDIASSLDDAHRDTAMQKLQPHYRDLVSQLAKNPLFTEKGFASFKRKAAACRTTIRRIREADERSADLASASSSLS